MHNKTNVLRLFGETCCYHPLNTFKPTVSLKLELFLTKSTYSNDVCNKPLFNCSYHGLKCAFFVQTCTLSTFISFIEVPRW